MRKLWTVLALILWFVAPTLAHEEAENGHHHEPHHWEDTLVRRELVMQMVGMGILGGMIGAYMASRRVTR